MPAPRPFGLYKRFVHFEAFMHESIIRVLPSPTGIAHNSATPLHVYCATYDPPLRMPYTVQYWQCNISKGQAAVAAAAVQSM